MVDFEQETVDRKRPPVNPVRGFAGNAAGVASDAVSLAELQLKLARSDARECGSRLRVPFGLAVLGGSGLLASLPVLSHGLATVLANSSGIAKWQSELIVASGLIVMSAVALLSSFHAAKNAAAPMRRSLDELSKNMTWLRAMLGSADNRNSSRDDER